MDESGWNLKKSRQSRLIVEIKWCNEKITSFVTMIVIVIVVWFLFSGSDSDLILCVRVSSTSTDRLKYIYVYCFDFCVVVDFCFVFMKHYKGTHFNSDLCLFCFNAILDSNSRTHARTHIDYVNGNATEICVDDIYNVNVCKFYGCTSTNLISRLLRFKQNALAIFDFYA